MGPVVEAAHASRLMAVLPRVLTAEQTLPPAPSFAPEADWYTAQLWLTIDGVLLSIAHE